MPITTEVIVAMSRLPSSFHHEPADRLIVSTGRALGLPLATFDDRIRRSGLVSIWSAAVHPDSFDRMLVAQAKTEPLVLLTNDAVLAGYGECVELVASRPLRK